MSSDEQFAAVVHKHYEPLFRFALSLTCSESEAGDLTQQTFYVWATKGHQLRDYSKVKSWLFTTLHRLFLETRRRQNRFPHDPLDEVHEELLTQSPRFEDQTDCSAVLSALAQIDAVYRGAVALFYLEDCSYTEVAVILDIPLGTVRSRIARGIRQLRNLLLSDGLNDSGLNGSPTTVQTETREDGGALKKHACSAIQTRFSWPGIPLQTTGL
jgi:RNA polymerase sigma-70 factor (ECF subfamily)